MGQDEREHSRTAHRVPAPLAALSPPCLPCRCVALLYGSRLRCSQLATIAGRLLLQRSNSVSPDILIPLLGAAEESIIAIYIIWADPSQPPRTTRRLPGRTYPITQPRSSLMAESRPIAREVTGRRRLGRFLRLCAMSSEASASAKSS